MISAPRAPQASTEYFWQGICLFYAPTDLITGVMSGGAPKWRDLDNRMLRHGSFGQRDGISLSNCDFAGIVQQGDF